MPLTHATAVIEVSFDDFAGLAVSITHSTAVLFGGGADDAVAADFLKQNECSITKQLELYNFDTMFMLE